MFYEPKPGLKKPPRQNPRIKVGIVLASDGVKKLDISGTSQISFANLEREYTSFGPLTLEEQEGKLRFGEELGSSAHLRSNCSQKVHQVPVGRGFHWQKSETFTYPGTLTATSVGNAIELINELSFEDYLGCVVTSEMGKNCPLEFAKAQMIAARSWAWVFLGTKHPEQGYDVCNDDDCQRYQGDTFLSTVAQEAREATRGMFLVDADENVVPAYYAKTCGGRSEDSQAMLQVSSNSVISAIDGPPGDMAEIDLRDEEAFKRYLHSPSHEHIFCSGRKFSEQELLQYLGAVDRGGILFRWKKSVSGHELDAHLRRLSLLHESERIKEIVLGRRSFSGRIVETTLETDSGRSIALLTQYSLRQALSPDFLYSSAIALEIVRDGDLNIKQLNYDGLGWGHGVGLCQVGALVQALEGRSAEEILKTYFPTAKVRRFYGA